MSLKNSLYIVLFSLSCFACTTHTETTSSTLLKKEVNSEMQHWQLVTVKYVGIEGGFYGLLTSTGGKFLPNNLALKYQVDGTVLKIKGNEVKGMMTIQQWGLLYEINDVELIRLGKTKENPVTRLKS